MYIFVFLCLALLFGCFCGIKFAAIDICFTLLAVGFVFVIKLVLFKTRTVENLCVFAVIFVFCCGAGLGIYHDHKTFSDVSHLYGTDITVTGKVTEVDDENFVVDTEYGRLTVYNYIDASVEKHNTVKVRGNLSAYETAQYNGGFDNRLHNALYGIVGKITCYQVEITGYEKEFSLWDAGASVRGKIENIVQSSGASARCKGFVTALLTGNTDKLDADVKEVFEITGTSHVTAVSGLHVGIFLSFFILFSKGMRKNRIIHALFVLTLVVMYTILIGERASVFRAGIMAVAGYAVFAMKRRSDPLMNLMIAGLLICFVNPYYVTAPGFQMSFIATLGLVMFAEYFKYPTVAVPVIATLFMLPVTLYYYNTVSFTTVFANVAVVFLVPFVVLAGYIGCFIPLFLYVACAIAELIITVAEFFASIDFLHFTLPSPDMRQFAMYFLLICGAYFCFGKRQFGKMAFMLAAVLVIYSNGLIAESVSDNGCSVKFINSGSYNMQHITTEKGYEIFLDCGLYASDYAVKNGVDDIFAVLVTNGYQNRREGLEKLCSKSNVKYVILPNSLSDENLKLENCEILYYNQDDFEFYIDNVTFKFTIRNDEHCLLMEIYDRVVAMPFDKTISDMGACTVMCVPDNCTDGAQAVENSIAEYYIHPTHRYEYYDFGNKYITSQVGMVNIIFKENMKPVLYTS